MMSRREPYTIFPVLNKEEEEWVSNHSNYMECMSCPFSLGIKDHGRDLIEPCGYDECLVDMYDSIQAKKKKEAEG